MRPPGTPGGARATPKRLQGDSRATLSPDEPRPGASDEEIAVFLSVLNGGMPEAN